MAASRTQIIRSLRSALASGTALLPWRVRIELQRALAVSGTPRDDSTYERLYEAHGRSLAPSASIGGGDFDRIGRIELGILLMEGLQSHHTLVDFGCGTGRLGVHVVGALTAGHYIGIDIADSMLGPARDAIARRHPTAGGRVRLLRQTDARFALDAASVDMLCAFSVFTHMEHEDTWRYLRDARRIVRPGGRLVFSCLPMSLAAAREIFLASSSVDPGTRWQSIRNVTTTEEFMERIAELAGWTVLRWYRGDEATIVTPGESAPQALGQSTCVLEHRASA
jgi:SAM-dependent methyltransferase